MSNAVPHGWSVQPLGKLADVRSSNVDKKSDASELPVRLCNYTDVYYRNRITSDIDFMHATAKQGEIDRFTLEKGDVIITKDSETPDDIAVPALVSESLPGVICGYHLTLLRPEPDRSNGEFLAHLFQLQSVQHYFYLLANGTTRFGLTAEAINTAPLITPPLPEQQKIATILSSVDDVIEKTRAQIDKLKDLKTGMMQELLTKGIGHTEFKDSPVGLVPAGWSVIELSNIVQKERPVTYGIVQTGPNSSNGVPCVRVVDLMKSELSTDNMIRTSQEISQQYKRTILQPGDIMFALRGEIGHVCKVEPVLEGANLTRGVALISPNQEVSTEYLLWALRSPGVRQNILDGVNGSALQEIPLGNLRSIKIPVPSIQEQNQIARTMDSIQSKLKEVSLKLDTVKSLKKALMQDLLTGKVRVNLTDKESAVV